MRCRLLLMLVAALAGCVGLQDLGDRPQANGAADGGALDGDSTSPRPGSDGGTTPDAKDGSSEPPDSILVAGGSFRYATRSGSVGQTKLTYDFWVDTNEVTVARFKVFEAAGKPAPCTDACSLDPKSPYAPDMLWFPERANQLGEVDYRSESPLATYGQGDQLPINLVNWYQAVAFCAFEGKRLLTDAEWQYIAIGRNEERRYPWGAEEPTDCDRAIWGKGGTIATAVNGCGFPLPGGSAALDVSRDGVRDLGGSLSEWVFDLPPSSVSVPAQIPDNPIRSTEFSLGQTRVTRGGNYQSLTEELEALQASEHSPSTGALTVGFRCAKSKL